MKEAPSACCSYSQGQHGNMHVAVIHQSDDIDRCLSCAVEKQKVMDKTRNVKLIPPSIQHEFVLLSGNIKQSSNFKKDLRVLLLLLDDIANLEIEGKVWFVTRGVASALCFFPMRFEMKCQFLEHSLFLLCPFGMNKSRFLEGKGREALPMYDSRTDFGC